MKSCNRVIVSVLVLLAGCGTEAPDLTTATVQNVGLVQGAGVPPVGEGIAPIGGAGGDGAPVGVLAVGWSSPGPVRWHGGQWVIPYQATPGTTLLNATCDVVPRVDATALVEIVSSNGQVLGSATVPAVAPTVVIRAWPFLGSHVIGDGEQLVMRISPRDAVAGAWTSAAQDMTVIGCAVNTTSLTSSTIDQIAPSVLHAGNNNNYSPSGFAQASVIKLSTGSGSPFLTGLSGGVHGKRVTLILAAMGDPLTITRLDGSSDPANQFLFPLPGGAAFLQMTALDQAITVVYDGDSAKWRLMARNF